MAISGWRAAALLILGLLVVSLLLAAVFWIGVLLAILALVGWVNLLLLPGLALRLRVPQLVLAIALLPLLAAAGLAVAGTGGVVAGCCVWAVGVALPRAALRRLRRRVRLGETRLSRVRVIDVSP